MPKHMTYQDVERMCAPFLQLEALGCPPEPDATIMLHNSISLGRKGQRVLLLPGLAGTITSSDGREIRVFYRDALRWLKTH